MINHHCDVCGTKLRSIRGSYKVFETDPETYELTSTIDLCEECHTVINRSHAQIKRFEDIGKINALASNTLSDVKRHVKNLFEKHDLMLLPEEEYSFDQFEEKLREKLKEILL